MESQFWKSRDKWIPGANLAYVVSPRPVRGLVSNKRWMDGLLYLLLLF